MFDVLCRIARSGRELSSSAPKPTETPRWNQVLSLPEKAPRAFQRPQTSPTTRPAPLPRPAAVPLWGSGNGDIHSASDHKPSWFYVPLELRETACGN